LVEKLSLARGVSAWDLGSPPLWLGRDQHVTARDASGNVKKTKATRTVKLAKLKRSKTHKKANHA
jgi:hypothetical protein